tara:strand:- start:242 stop:544 length:303 start_codon:yes stop_codon:yes gene_type:complete
MSNDLEARIAEIPDGEEYVSVDSIRPAEGERSQDRTITTYCITKLLKKSNGKLYGPFQPSKNVACMVKEFLGVIDQGAVLSIESAGRCNNGDAVTKIVYQ